MEGTGANFHVIRLEYHAALLGPVLLQGQDQVLEGARGGLGLAHEKYPFGCDEKPESIAESRG